MKCKNCGSALNKKDKYCNKCGTKTGTIKFIPLDNSFKEVFAYGLSIIAWHFCQECSERFDLSVLSKEKKICPRCSSRNSKKEKKN